MTFISEETEIPKTEPRSSLPRVMVVEDNIVSRRLLENSLVKAGYEVITAENGSQAFGLFKQQFCPIVITDWMMPQMSGPELCQAIRNHQTPGYVFIVLLTAKNSTDDIISGLEAGADDYLTKPFNRAELIARLSTACRILDLEKSLRRANDEIKILSITDPLTKVYNRAYLNEYLPQEISRARRFAHYLSIIMCDLDNFKNVNDQHGHEAGDVVLKAVSDSLKDSIRRSIDWVVRLGGEEFLIVLPETNLKGAHFAAERLRKTVEGLRIQYGALTIPITASFGVSSYDPHINSNGTSPDQLFREADQCLYAAKKEGRNLVRSSYPPSILSSS